MYNDFPGQDLYAEEFIDGREFKVMVVENINDPNDPIVLTPLEEIFKNATDFKSE